MNRIIGGGSRSAVISVIAAAALLLSVSACSAEPKPKKTVERPSERLSDDGKILTFADFDDLAINPLCTSVLRLQGDPDGFGPAEGLDCDLTTASSVEVRMYDDAHGTSKMIGDWHDVINEGLQVVYSGDWFAVGPKEALEELFRNYRKAGPQSVLPRLTETTPSESSIAVCSSMTYNVIVGSAKNEPDSELKETFEYFPGMRALRNKILVAAHADDTFASVTATEFDTSHAFFTRYDDEIKQYCKTQV